MKSNLFVPALVVVSTLLGFEGAATAQPTPEPIAETPPVTTPTPSPPVVVAVREFQLNVCLPDNLSEIPPSRSTELKATTRAGCRVDTRGVGGFAESENDRGYQPSVRNGDEIIVYADGFSLTLQGDGDIASAEYSIHKHGDVGTFKQCEAISSGYKWIKCVVVDDDFPEASHRDILEVRITRSSGAKASRYATFSRHVSLTGKTKGFWIPVGMFGTNFKPNDDGITLAALPIGLAWGVQYNFAGGAYIGLSAFGSWSIAPQKSNTNEERNGNYTVASATVGAFADLDGYLYAGYGYALDFRKDFSDPGSMFVVGVGPRLLEFLKAQ